ncbi:MAG: hypothetical protein ACOC5T_01740 [Elusimicrobiota bacterium]
MGRKRKKPTKVLSGRINAKDYLKAKRLAKQTGQTIIQAYRLLVKKGRL